MRPRVTAAVRGTHDSLILFTFGGRLGGIEYVSIDKPGLKQFPPVERLDAITVATEPDA